MEIVRHYRYWSMHAGRRVKSRAYMTLEWMQEAELEPIMDSFRDVEHVGGTLQGTNAMGDGAPGSAVWLEVQKAKADPPRD